MDKLAQDQTHPARSERDFKVLSRPTHSPWLEGTGAAVAISSRSMYGLSLTEWLGDELMNLMGAQLTVRQSANIT